MWRDLSMCIKLHRKQTGNSECNSDNKSKPMTFGDVLKQFLLKWHNFGHAPCLRKNKPPVLMDPARCCCSFSTSGRWGESSMWGEECFILVHHLQSRQYSPINSRRVGCCTPASTRQHFKLHPSIHHPSVRPSARPPHRPGFTSQLHGGSCRLARLHGSTSTSCPSETYHMGDWHRGRMQWKWRYRWRLLSDPRVGETQLVIRTAEESVHFCRILRISPFFLARPFWPCCELDQCAFFCAVGLFKNTILMSCITCSDNISLHLHIPLVLSLFQCRHTLFHHCCASYYFLCCLP